MAPEQTILNEASGIISHVASYAKDERIWFVTVITWVLLERTKFLWDQVRPSSKRNRLTELVAFVIAGGLALWTFWDSAHPYKIALSLGLLNPYLYKLCTALVEWKFPQIRKVLGFKEYKVVVEDPDGNPNTDDTVLAIRSDGEKTIRIPRKKAQEYVVDD